MNPAAPAGAAGGPTNDVPTLYTLSEVAEATGIPLAELDRYRRRHGDRVPSIVLGETRRYPAEALAVFRDLHREDDAGGPPVRGGRRLMSLTAQLRRRAPEPAARPAGGADAGRPAPGARDEAGAANGTSGTADRGAAGGPAEPTALPAPPSRWPSFLSTLHREREAAAGEARPAESRRTEAQTATAGTAAAPQREAAAPGRTAAGEPAAPAPGESAAPGEIAGKDEPETVEVLARSGHEPVPPPSRPARPLFTLQQVHEHTGIPYPTLAFYAAAHADRVPAVGERYAKLYPWEAMDAFARVHAEKTPGWSPPELAAPDSVVAWRRDDGLAGRLAQLQKVQDELADELESLVRDLAGPLSGFAR